MSPFTRILAEYVLLKKELGILSVERKLFQSNIYFKIHSFLKKRFHNLQFIKTRYFPRNLSISCSIQVPCFDKLKIVHNTVLKMNGL